MNKLHSKLTAKYYLWKVKRAPFERVAQDYSKKIEDMILKSGRETNKIKIDDKIFNIWSRIQNSRLKQDLGKVGKSYSRDEFIRDLESV